MAVKPEDLRAGQKLRIEVTVRHQGGRILSNAKNFFFVTGPNDTLNIGHLENAEIVYDTPVPGKTGDQWSTPGQDITYTLMNADDSICRGGRWMTCAKWTNRQGGSGYCEMAFKDKELSQPSNSFLTKVTS